jgi:hypothetical protein
MSHADDAYEHPIPRHDPAEGFDRSEPDTPAIWMFTVGSVAVLILTIVAVAAYFDQVYQEAVTEKVLRAPTAQLQEVRNRDAWNLSHYMYGDLDKKSNRVRVPVDNAMQSFAQDAAAGKLFYPAKASAIKKEEPAAAPAAPTAEKK